MKNEVKSSAGRRPSPIVIGTVSIAALAAFGVQAQEQGGALATFGLSFGGQYTANDPGEDESSFRTRLSFGLRSETNVQSFALSTDAALVFDEEGFDFETPGLSLDYARSNRSTALSFGLDYSIRDVESDFAVIDPVTQTLVDRVEDDGTLETLGVRAVLETGRDAPLGTITQFSFTDRGYSGTADPDLNDLESWQIGTTLRFDVDPRISLRASANHRETREQDDARTESLVTRYGVGGSFLIDPLWSASVDLGYSFFETGEVVLGSRVVTEEEGAGFSLSVTRQFRDGVLGVSLARNVSDMGAEDSLQVSRDRQFANGAEMAWSLGVVSLPGGDTVPIASLSYAKPTQRGDFTAAFRQSTAVTAGDDNVITTSAILSYSEQINANSRWSLNGSFSSIDVRGSDLEDRSRVQIGISYNHALTRDWDLSSSLSHRIIYDDGAGDDSASTLSLSLERSFSFRP